MRCKVCKIWKEMGKGIVKKCSMKTTGKVSMLVMMILAMGITCGCSIEQSNQTKVSDLEYEIIAEEDIPEELLSDIEERKTADFKLTYETDEYLYIVRGYGEQETGGYSIRLKELYLTTNSVFFYTELIGPRKGETITKSPSFPYIVVRTGIQEKNVVFE